MKGLTIFLLALATALSMEAQTPWASIGKFNTHTGVDLLWYDSVAQRLYAAGTYTWFDSTEVHGFGYILGDTVIGLGCGFEVDCGVQLIYNSAVPKVTGFARYQGDLYVTGYFRKAGGVVVNGIAKWGGSDWVPVGSGFALNASTNASPGIGYGIEVMNGELYVYGGFDSINGIPANSMAKFDGTNWSTVFDLPRFGSSPSNVNMIFDAEWFAGELYVGGNFDKAGTNPPIQDLVKWDGTNWVAVGPGLTGAFGAITTLLTWDSKLVIAGSFSPVFNPGSIPGNQIVIWDGLNWDTLRGGVHLDFYGNGSVLQAMEYKGDLYVAGAFNHVGNTPARNFARWDGTEWCGNDGPKYNFRSFAFLDDTLFISFGWGYISSDSSAIGVVKWTNGAWEGTSCQGPVSLVETAEPEPALLLFPNPTQGTFRLGPSPVSSCTLNILDCTGRMVMTLPGYRGSEVDISSLSAGLYLVEVVTRKGVQVLKLAKRD